MVIPVRKPSDRCAYTEDMPISGSQWIKTPSIILYRYLGYYDHHKEGVYDLPRINRRYLYNNTPLTNTEITKEKKKKLKKHNVFTDFKLPTEIPYLNTDEMCRPEPPPPVNPLLPKMTSRKERKVFSSPSPSASLSLASKQQQQRPFTCPTLSSSSENRWNRSKKYDKKICHRKFKSTYSNLVVPITHLSKVSKM